MKDYSCNSHNKKVTLVWKCHLYVKMPCPSLNIGTKEVFMFCYRETWSNIKGQHILTPNKDKNIRGGGGGGGERYLLLWILAVILIGKYGPHLMIVMRFVTPNNFWNSPGISDHLLRFYHIGLIFIIIKSVSSMQEICMILEHPPPPPNTHTHTLFSFFFCFFSGIDCLLTLIVNDQHLKAMKRRP